MPIARTLCLAFTLLLFACAGQPAELRGERGSGGGDSAPPVAFQGTRTLSLNGVTVEVVIDKPARPLVDAFVVYHGSVGSDALILQAATRTLDEFRALLDRDDIMLVSVAYPEEGLPFGENLREAEAALLWVKGEASAALGVQIGRIFLGGHSQGGYLVTRLNTLHAVDGVVANAPGPLDLLYRCGLEEAGEELPSAACGVLSETFGTTIENPEAYASRSLLRFTTGQRSRLFVVQGMDDAPVQMRSWPMFRAALEACADCAVRTFLELPGMQHPALFRSAEARAALQAFLDAP